MQTTYIVQTDLYGTVNNSGDDNTATFRKRCDHLSKRQLKKQLVPLKAESSKEKILEIWYISMLIRHKYKKPTLTINDSNHDEKIRKLLRLL